MEPSFKNAIYSTALLKSLETITTVAVLIVSSVLLLALLTGVRRFTMQFFKILTVLVAVIVIRSGCRYCIQTCDFVVRTADCPSEYHHLGDRHAILYRRNYEQSSVSAREYRYIALCLVCFVIAAAETYIVITMSNLRREFIVEIGFVDFIDSAEAYEIRQRMFREIALMAIVNTMFTLLFILLYRIPSSNESRIMIISIYNILCFIPDILIPVFILIGSSEVHAEISSRFSRLTRTKRPSSRKTVTMK
ncbi:hypothetical protein OSTOST_21899 [Ostertagia ostertagi]